MDWLNCRVTGRDEDAPFPGFPGSQAEAERWRAFAPLLWPPTPPGLERAPLFYLDQKIWISLLKGGGLAGEQAFRLHELVESGVISVALSTAHYVETWHRGDWMSRWELARLMWDITRLVALPPMHALIRGEIADALGLFGVAAPGVLASEVPIGQGVNFAFASPTGRISHIDEQGDVVEWSELSEDARRLHSAGVGYEWFSLAGLPYDMRADGLDLATNRHAGLRFADHEANLARALGDKRGLARTRPLTVGALRDIESEIVEACLASNVSPRPFLLWLFEGDQHRASQFLDGMPSYGTFQLLRKLRHANPQKPWEGNDRQDLLALSVALTSCDVVVTEKYWSHIAAQAGFTGQGTARAYSSLDQALHELR